MLPCCPVSPVALRKCRGFRSGRETTSKEQLSYETAGESAPGRIGGTPPRGLYHERVCVRRVKGRMTMNFFYFFIYFFDYEFLKLLNKMAQQHEMRKHFQYYVSPKEKCPKEMQLKIFFNLTIH